MGQGTTRSAAGVRQFGEGILHHQADRVAMMNQEADPFIANLRREMIASAGALRLRTAPVVSEDNPGLSLFSGSTRIGHECVHLQKLMAFLADNRLQISAPHDDHNVPLDVHCNTCEVTFHNVYLDQLEGSSHA